MNRCAPRTFRVFNSLKSLLLVAGLVTVTACSPAGQKSGAPSERGQAAPAGTTAEKPKLPTAPEPAENTTLYLSQAQFIYQTGDDGKAIPVPGPARLVIYTWSGGTWIQDVVEDPESNVFHKAAFFTPANGEPGILTIGAMGAHLKLWRKTGGTWQAETLWSREFGGKFDRLRDFEVGDVNSDGNDEIVIATHDQGVIAVASWKSGKYAVEEITRKPDTFVHEIELGDVDGDGIIEIFTTPSKPNKMDGSIQPGEIDIWKWMDGNWVNSKADEMPTRHAKEILCATLTGESRPVLFTALEGENLGGGTGGDSTRIRMYRFENEAVEKTDIASMPGNLCRFLTCGDTDGDGVKELIASTKDDGIWKLIPEDGGWKKMIVAHGTSGFEHSTFLFDSNGDGVDEIWVASDEQGELRRYWYNGRGYSADIISSLKEHTITFNLTVH